jgi:protein TonB
MWNFMFAEPIYLAALFLNSSQVLLGLGIVSFIIAGYIFYKKSSYRPDGERMLQKTALNKSVGFMAALALVLIVMSWTSKSQEYDLFSGDLVPDSDQLVMVNTYVLEELPPPPLENIDPPKLESTEIEVTEEPEPAPDPEEKKSPEGSKEGTGKSTAGPKGPMLPPPPKVKLPKKKEIEIVKPFEEFAEQMPRFADNKCEDLKGSDDATLYAKKACADQALAVYLAKTVHYPEMARTAGFEGRVYVRFIVELDGSISNIEVIKDQTPGGGLKEAALRAVKQMAKKKEWIAGEQAGRKVRVRMVVPINFTLHKR